eukprot:scaffold178565_cov20-Prasinocladus_malaysianus.AAC.1
MTVKGVTCASSPRCPHPCIRKRARLYEFITGSYRVVILSCILGGGRQSAVGSLLDAAEAAELIGASGESTGLLDLAAEQIAWEVDDQYIDHLQ